MKKTKKRNELTVFEEFRLKPADFRDKPPKKNKLLIIGDIYFYYNTKLKKNTYWILTEPEYSQVNEYREGLDTDDEDYFDKFRNKEKLRTKAEQILEKNDKDD